MLKYCFFLMVFTALMLSCNSPKGFIKNSFSAEQTSLIMEADSSLPMRVFKINNKNDSILLRTKSSYVKPDTKDIVLQTLVKRLYKTVTDSISLGVGIAAPQVGILKNIIWVQRFDKDNFPFEVYLNPIINEYSTEKQTCREGCLSIPNRSETLNSRAYSIKITYDTTDGINITETVAGFTSVIFQHEIDHLNGILYLDYIDSVSSKIKE